MNILIAEDDQMIQELNSYLMEDWGYNFDIASDGLEAVELVKRNKNNYDLCLMDVDMPHMNGIEATKIIRKISNYFPIMALTANATYKKACYEAGMDDFAQKPCPPKDLFARINELTVKLHKFKIKPDGFEITEVMPVDKSHADELKKLKSQGLIKMRLDGPSENEVIAHRNIPNKISHDFNILKQSMTEFINRDPDRPTICDLYRGTKNCIVETFIDSDDYQAKLKAEDNKMDSYQSKHYKADDE